MGAAIKSVPGIALPDTVPDTDADSTVRLVWFDSDADVDVDVDVLPVPPLSLREAYCSAAVGAALCTPTRCNSWLDNCYRYQLAGTHTHTCARVQKNV